MFTVHFTDKYGQGAIDTETRQQAILLKNALNADADCENVWIEEQEGDC